MALNMDHPSAFSVPQKKASAPVQLSKTTSQLKKPAVTKQGKDAMNRLAAEKNPIFRYKSTIGHLPKEAETFVYVKRKDRVRNKIIVVPEMVYPLEANRICVPKHQALEDDWRAYRSAIHNFYAIARSQQQPWERELEQSKILAIVTRVLSSSGMPPELLSKTNVSKIIPNATVDLYKNGMAHPAGFLYRHYKNGKVPPQMRKSNVKNIVISDPFQHMSRAPSVSSTEPDWDADVIINGTEKTDLFVYNEPDAIPASCVRTNFAVPITKRVENIVTSAHYSRQADRNIRIALPVPPRAPVVPMVSPSLLPKQMGSSRMLAASPNYLDSLMKGDKYANALNLSPE
ncbi:uncharacterized protein LOC131951797 [Physella acuta]|uniref:uncharacterized protein LOC131951797 n=1 Tax=Physella acuta TaxID=109671 RepID=UPI0027DBFD09|nr:uncharacterized protein LOC131951797 [Physella acuta]XP_059170179.1 uncharacterized protein LOC131951797 [Physella acuta]